MNHFNGSFFGRSIIVLLVAAAVAGGPLPVLGGAAEDDEEGICARAVSNCLGTAGGAALAVDWKSMVKALLICIVGYEFCIRYVEPYIREEAQP